MTLNLELLTQMTSYTVAKSDHHEVLHPKQALQVQYERKAQTTTRDEMQRQPIQ